MTNGFDSRLQALFRQAEEPLDATVITGRVMAATRKRQARLWGGGIAAALAAVLAVWLALGVPLLVFAVQVSNLLTTSLVDLGEGWLALILLPINSVAGVLALTAKAVYILRKKIFGRPFAG